MDTEQLCGLLAEPTRLRTYAAVVLGATSPTQISASTGLPEPSVHKALHRLTKGGLLITSRNGFAAVEDAFKTAVRSNRLEREPLDPDPARDDILRAFIRDGRLTHFPTVPAKLRIVLEHLASTFEPGRTYLEPEVNALLNHWHPDHATLRRQLVDARLMTRTNNRYTRTHQP